MIRRFFTSSSGTATSYLIVALILCVGCGKGAPARYERSGKVTYDGESIPAGTITFEPRDTVVNKTTIGEAEIKDGQYKTLPGKGAIAGPNKVFISGYNGVPEPGSGPHGASLLPVHATEVEFPAASSTCDFDVPAGERPNHGRIAR